MHHLPMRFHIVHRTLLIWLYLVNDGATALVFLKQRRGATVTHQRPNAGPCCSVHRDNEDFTSSAPLTPGAFNPFNYNAKQGLSTPSSTVYASSSKQVDNTQRANVISLRRTQMQALTNAMLNAVPFEKEQLLVILKANEQFLLEPLEDDNAVQETDSIYRSCTNRSERYRTFAESMDSRLQAVKDPSARLVLSTMKDFVLQFEGGTSG